MKIARSMRLILILSAVCLLVLSLVGCDQLLDIHEHVIVENEGQEPTCTDAGWKAYQTCSECNVYSTYVSVPALGHDYSDTYIADGEVHTRACTQCSEVLVSAHSWGTPAVTSPSCTDVGSKVYTCSDCGAKKIETLSRLGHDYYESRALLVQYALRPSAFIHTIGRTARLSQTLPAPPTA